MKVKVTIGHTVGTSQVWESFDWHVNGPLSHRAIFLAILDWSSTLGLDVWEVKTGN